MLRLSAMIAGGCVRDCRDGLLVGRVDGKGFPIVGEPALRRRENESGSASHEVRAVSGNREDIRTDSKIGRGARL
jgi:hypothetical protein